MWPGVIHMSESYLGARYRYLRAKLGGLKAVKAMARVLACLYNRLVTKGQVWVDRGTAEFEQRRQQRDLATLQRKARSLGLQLVRQRKPRATDPAASRPTQPFRNGDAESTEITTQLLSKRNRSRLPHAQTGCFRRESPFLDNFRLADKGCDWLFPGNLPICKSQRRRIAFLPCAIFASARV
jgi:hypothetical protein